MGSTEVSAVPFMRLSEVVVEISYACGRPDGWAVCAEVVSTRVLYSIAPYTQDLRHKPRSQLCCSSRCWQLGRR